VQSTAYAGRSGAAVLDLIESLCAPDQKGDPRSSGTGAGSWELGAGSAPRGIGSIEQLGDGGGQLEQLQLLRRVGNGKGHAAVVLLGRHGAAAGRG
jgi:hypothetical protein